MQKYNVTIDLSQALRETMHKHAEERREIESIAKAYGVSQKLVAQYAETYENWQEVFRLNMLEGLVL